jgi:DNA polymerase III delta subunit
MVYLFVGQDKPAKDIQLARIKQEFLAKELESFNLDILYAKELSLKGLQEKLLCLPVKSKKRIIVIRDAECLKEDIRNFILDYVKKPPKQIVLVLDIGHRGKDGFISHLSRHAKVILFKEALQLNTFTLTDQIARKRPDYALRILNQLLREGEKPERILGGLRYAWERDIAYPLETKRKLKLLLNCDIDIKTGRLKPAFALEKLVISLCTPAKPFR